MVLARRSVKAQDRVQIPSSHQSGHLMQKIKKAAKAVVKTTSMCVAGFIVPIALLFYAWGYCNEEKSE